MGFISKVMGSLHVNDDDYDDDYDDYEDDYEEERPRRSLFKKKEEDYDLEDDLISETKPKVSRPDPARIVPMRQKRGNGMEVCVFKPTKFDESKEIADTLLQNCTAVLNFEGLDVEIAQRIIDFSSGACYAMGGNLQKVSDYIFIAAPRSVDISGDYQDIMSGAFDIPNL